MPLRRLLARYDGAALRPPAPDARRPEAAEQAAFEALRRWCLSGGSAPALAVLDDTDPTRAPRLAAQLALERDGSWQLAACRGALARLQLRALTQLHDVMASRPRRDSDPWDSGYLINTPAGRAALARFEPRRPTLLLAEGVPPGVSRDGWQALQRRQVQAGPAIRLLLVGPAPDWARALAAPVFGCGPQP